jgi:OmpA-OmpF porin, OOP family
VSPEREKLLWRLLYVAGAAFFLLGAFTAWLGPNSASNLEARLQKAADEALVSANLTSWSARAQGAAVHLEGVAASEDDKREAVRMLKTATGNGDVRSAKVILAPLANPFIWTARKENGFVTIEGVAPSRQALVAIHDTAKRLYPSRMTDQTTLASGAPEGVDWGAAAVSGLEALRKLERGSVKLSGSELHVAGLAASDTDAQIASNWVLRAEGGVKPKVDIIGPPEFVATVQDRKIVLQGKVGSESAQRELSRAASGARSVTNQTYVASVGPWHKRAVKALSVLAQLDRGEIAVQGRVFRIGGEAPGSVIGYLREDMAAISDGYQIDYKVTEAEPDLSDFPGLNLAQTGKAKADACQLAFNRVAGANRIVFASNRAQIARVSGPSLDRLVTVARACAELEIEIQGHTDGTGRRPANLALSRERAQAVKDYLVGRGLSADRLTAVGFGPDRPVASNRNESGRAKNRRIEFRVIRGEAP